MQPREEDQTHPQLKAQGFSQSCWATDFEVPSQENEEQTKSQRPYLSPQEPRQWIVPPPSDRFINSHKVKLRISPTQPRGLGLEGSRGADKARLHRIREMESRCLMHPHRSSSKTSRNHTGSCSGTEKGPAGSPASEHLEGLG